MPSLLPKDLEIALGVRLLRVLQFAYELTDGRVGARVGRLKLLLLRVPGRRTGRMRTVELAYVEDGADLAVVGSKGGSDRPPAWLLNLQAHPEAEVQIGRTRLPVVGRVAAPDERDRLWRRVNEVWDYEAYQRRSNRPIPIVLLRPAPARASARRRAARPAVR